MGIEASTTFLALGLSVEDTIKGNMLGLATDLHYEVTKGKPSPNKFGGSYGINPQRTGRLKASWDINTTGGFKDVGEGYDSPSSTVIKPKLPDKSKIKDILYLTNGTPYVGWVEAGINPWVGETNSVKDHKKFVHKATLRVT